MSEKKMIATRDGFGKEIVALGRENPNLLVVDMHTSKPLDVEAVTAAVHDIGRIITVEDHNILNGLGSAVCEVAGKRGGGVFGGAHYSASKAAVPGSSKNLAREVSRYNITTNCVCPGLINTDIWKSMSPEQAKPVIDAIPMGRPGEPEEVAGPSSSWRLRRPATSPARRSTSTAAPIWTDALSLDAGQNLYYVIHMSNINLRGETIL